VGAGSTVDLGSNTLDLGCGTLIVAGTFDTGSGTVEAVEVSIGSGGTLLGGTGTLDITGNWDNGNGGSFTSGSSTVNLIEGCAVTTAVVSGSTGFSNLHATTTAAKTIEFEASSTQTIAGALTLAGAAGNLLSLRSTSPGSEAFLNLLGSAASDYVDVVDVHAAPTPIALGPHSVAGSNTTGFGVRPCGDLDGDLAIGEPDATLAREHLVGNAIAGNIRFCNVVGPVDPLGFGGDCELSDIFLIRRFAAGESATLQPVCMPLP